MMNNLEPEFIRSSVIEESSALVLCAYTLGDTDLPIYKATMMAADLARSNDIPVILILGTRGLVSAIRERLIDFIKRYVTVIAMNEEEAEALTDLSDPLLASDKALEYTDMVLLTAGSDGLYLSGYTEKDLARKTDNPIRSAGISDFNHFEFSRPLRKKDCSQPKKVFSHINPYMGQGDLI